MNMNIIHVLLASKQDTIQWCQIEKSGIFVCIVRTYVCHFVLGPRVFVLLGGRPCLHIPLNRILWFIDLYPYHQLFTPLIFCGRSYVLET